MALYNFLFLYIFKVNKYSRVKKSLSNLMQSKMFFKDINNTLPWNVLIFYALCNNSIFRKPLEYLFVALNTSFSCFKKKTYLFTHTWIQVYDYRINLWNPHHYSGKIDWLTQISLFTFYMVLRKTMKYFSLQNISKYKQIRNGQFYHQMTITHFVYYAGENSKMKFS